MIGRDAGRGGPGKRGGTFDNTGSCLQATTVQDAILELQGIGPAYVAVAAEAIAMGQILYIDVNSQMALADASAAQMNEATPYGIAISSAAAGANVCYTTHGRVTLSDWNSVAGSPNLATSSPYFLSATNPGGIGTSCSTGVLAHVGRAVSPTTFDFRVGHVVRLAS